jgi:hypothetical protein
LEDSELMEEGEEIKHKNQKRKKPVTPLETSKGFKEGL